MIDQLDHTRRGEPLLSFLDQMPLMDRKVNSPLMVPISEKYSDMGCVVVGKLESGKVRKNQDLLLMPNKTPVQATAIYNEMEEEVPIALSGDNVRIRLRGIEDTDINVGFVLTDPKKPVHAVTQFEAQLVIIDTKNIITAGAFPPWSLGFSLIRWGLTVERGVCATGYSAILHIHTDTEEVNLAQMLHYYDRKTGESSSCFLSSRHFRRELTPLPESLNRPKVSPSASVCQEG